MAPNRENGLGTSPAGLPGTFYIWAFEQSWVGNPTNIAVTNIGSVDVDYTLFDLNGDDCGITPLFSTDGGSTWF